MSGTIPTQFAQSFLVDATEAPNGVFIAAVDVCFAYKDDSLPITLQMRPMDGDYPDFSHIYYGGESTLQPADIPTTSSILSDIPSLDDATTYARFYFPSLVYLKPGAHAFTFSTASPDYLLYVAQLQDQIIGSTRSASAAPHVGNLFRAQNAGTLTAVPNQSLMFRLLRAKFNTQSASQIELRSLPPASNINMDIMNLSVNDIVVGKTDLTYLYKASDTSGTLDTNFSPITPGVNVFNTARKAIRTSSNGDFRVYTTLASDSDFVSPIVDLSRLNLIGIENIINYGELSNSSIQITNPGSGFNGGAVTVTISSPNASYGTAATATANITGNVLTGITLTGTGTGYIDTPTITISGGSPGVAATANIVGETSSSGGNAGVRYITRKIVLASGFDARDIVVYLTGMRPVGSDIQVYYKVLSSQDPDQNFDNKKWFRMSYAIGSSQYSQNKNDYVEYKFAPPGAIAVPSTNITYVSGGATFTTFKTFAIKICLFSSDKINVPVVKNLRAIALA